MWKTLAAMGAVAACLCVPEAKAQEAVSDPFEGANRAMFGVHEAVDQAVLEPAARGYRAVTPRPVRKGVTNFLRNLRSPVILANDLLQGEGDRAGTTIARFGVNTALGFFGTFDPATSMGLERHDEDFGQTLGRWGVGEGPYFFVPVLGPTNLRDSVGRVVDTAFDPLSWAEFEGDDAVRGTRGALTGLSAREALLEPIDSVRQDSLDPYVTFRSTYQSLRESAIRNGPMDVQELPDFEAIPEPETPPVASPPPDGVAQAAQ